MLCVVFSFSISHERIEKEKKKKISFCVQGKNKNDDAPCVIVPCCFLFGAFGKCKNDSSKQTFMMIRENKKGGSEQYSREIPDRVNGDVSREDGCIG